MSICVAHPPPFPTAPTATVHRYHDAPCPDMYYRYTITWRGEHQEESDRSFEAGYSERAGLGQVAERLEGTAEFCGWDGIGKRTQALRISAGIFANLQDGSRAYPEIALFSASSCLYILFSFVGLLYTNDHSSLPFLSLNIDPYFFCVEC